MILNAKVGEINSWPTIESWRVCPKTGNKIKLGDQVVFGNEVTLGDWVKLGDRVALGDGVKLNDEVILDDQVELDDQVQVGNGVILGYRTRVGKETKLSGLTKVGRETVVGVKATLGDGVMLGNWVNIGKEVTLGSWVKLGDNVTLGHQVKLGNQVVLGNWVRLSNGTTSTELNLAAIQAWKELRPSHIFSKWVTKDRMSPNFDGGETIKYEKGAIIEVDDAKISDQQCGPGLHVLRFGLRPQWFGLCPPNHDLIHLRVEVCSNDICFGGLPTMDSKLRVRKLRVLD